MKILLVRPPVPEHTMGLKHIMICEPLELEYAAAGLDGHEVMIIDLIIESGFVARLQEFSPDVVGSSCFITGVNEVIKIMRQVKTLMPTCFTVVGGVHAAQVPEDFADASVDVIVRGDGTTILPQVVQALADKSSLYGIPGLAIPVGDGQVELTGERPYMPAADSLPLPRRDLVAHLQHKYYYLMHQPVATMKTTWGCWYRCNFCYTWQITGGVPYVRSPASIVAELEQISADDIYIVDDIFLIKPSRLAELAQLIRERGIRKRYLVYARADFIATHESIIAQWAELGLSAVFIGLEAATDPELTSMDKESSVNYNEEAIAVLRRHGVDTYGSLIPNPDYGPEDWQRLWRFIETNKLYYVNISPLTPMPGTSIWDQYKDQLTIPRRAHGLWDLSHVLMPTRMPLKAYYRALLTLYAKTILNLSRAATVTQRTLPSIWSRPYLKILLGSFKIARQFLQAHKHHSPEELRKAMDRGPKVSGLDYTAKFKKPEFKRLKLNYVTKYQNDRPIMAP